MVVAAVAGSVSDLVLSGPLLVAVLIAAAAGAVSFFSPCCLPLVPGYLSYVAGVAGSEARPAPVGDGEGLPPGGTGAVSVAGAGGVEAVVQAPTRTATRPVLTTARRSRTVLGAVLFVAGFAAVFTSYGALFGAFGGLLISYQDMLVRVLGVVTILLGLVFTGLLWRIPLAGRTFKLGWRPRAGLLGAPLVGVLFGLGWTPCIGPTLAAVLTLATSSADAGRGATLSFAYSAGLGVPFIVAAVSVQKAMVSFGWARRHARTIMRAGGAMLVLLGLLQVTGLWLLLISRLQGLITGWQVPL
jgi:cytochrome c-type biogenesis protein